jgi:hypothetical protein
MKISCKRNKLPVRFRRYAFFIVFIIQALAVSGQDTISDSLITERLQDINKLLEKDIINARGWWYGWLAGYSVATVGQGIVYFSSDNKSTRQDMALGAATTFLGAIGQLLTPIVPKSSSAGDSRIAQSGSPDQFKELYNSEELLKELALREKAGRSWKIHAVTGAVNVGSGLITWLAFKRSFWDGVEIFALNTVITETQIWTQPARAIKDYKNYCRKYNTGSDPIVLKPEKEWLVHVYPGGITIELNF